MNECTLAAFAHTHTHTPSHVLSRSRFFHTPNTRTHHTRKTVHVSPTPRFVGGREELGQDQQPALRRRPRMEGRKRRRQERQQKRRRGEGGGGQRKDLDECDCMNGWMHAYMYVFVSFCMRVCKSAH